MEPSLESNNVSKDLTKIVEDLSKENAELRGELTSVRQKMEDVKSSFSTKTSESTRGRISIEQFITEIEQCRSQNSTLLNNICLNEESSDDCKGSISSSHTLIEEDQNEQEFKYFKVSPRLKSLNEMVSQYRSQKRFGAAASICRIALNDCIETKGRDDPDVATILTISSFVLSDQNKFKEEVSVLKHVLLIRESQFGMYHMTVAATLNNLGIAYAKLGNNRLAELLCKKSLNIREKLLGPYHLEVAKELNNLAVISYNQGNYTESEKYYKRLLNIVKWSFCNNDPRVMAVTGDLIRIYFKQGKFKEAEKLNEEMKRFQKILHRKNVFSTTNNQGDLTNGYNTE